MEYQSKTKNAFLPSYCDSVYPGLNFKTQMGNFSSQKGNIRACVPPLSHQIPLQWVRRGRFCLLDRLMRQGSRRKDSGQREVMVGSWFLLTLSRYPHLINWTWEQFVCLFRFVLGCARPCLLDLPVFVFIPISQCVRSTQRGRFVGRKSCRCHWWNWIGSRQNMQKACI